MAGWETMRTANVKVNGCYFPNTDKYEFLKEAFLEIIPEARKGYKLGEDEICGSRFSTDLSVWARVRGGFGRTNFALEFADVLSNTLPKEEMKDMVTKALRDCAQADYWYMYEKEY